MSLFVYAVLGSVCFAQSQLSVEVNNHLPRKITVIHAVSVIDGKEEIEKIPGTDILATTTRRTMKMIPEPLVQPHQVRNYKLDMAQLSQGAKMYFVISITNEQDKSTHCRILSQQYHSFPLMFDQAGSYVLDVIADGQNSDQCAVTIRSH